MSTTEHEKTKVRDDLEKLIEKAIRKVSGRRENDLCKYLPGTAGGYMHHFTLRKLKHAEPQQLFALLQKFVVDNDKPKALDPKPRAPRGSRKRKDFFSFSRTDIEKVLDLARRTGDRDLVARFSPKRSLPALKKELLRSIREHTVNHELWNAYAEAVQLAEKTQ